MKDWYVKSPVKTDSPVPTLGLKWWNSDQRMKQQTVVKEKGKNIEIDFSSVLKSIVKQLGKLQENIVA